MNAIIAPYENPKIYFFLARVFLNFFKKYFEFSVMVLAFQGILTTTGEYPSFLRIFTSSLYATLDGDCLNPGIINITFS